MHFLLYAMLVSDCCFMHHNIFLPFVACSLLHFALFVLSCLLPHFFLFSFLWNTAFQKYVFRFVNLSMLCWFSRLSSEVADSCIYLSSIEFHSRIFIWTNRFSLILAEITHSVKVLTVFQKDKKIYYSAGFENRERSYLQLKFLYSSGKYIYLCVGVFVNKTLKKLLDERAMGFDANYFATFFVCCNYG